MISDVKGHDMKDHMVCNCALWWISMAVRTWLRLQFDLITNTFHFGKLDTLHLDVAELRTHSFVGCHSMGSTFSM